MRDLSKIFNEKELKFILSQIKDDYDTLEYSDDEFEGVSDIVKYFGVNDLHWDEFGFFIKLVELNPDYENLPIVVPKLKTMDVYLGIDLTEYVYETWSHSINTYLDAGDEDQINDQMSETSYWEGNLVERDIYSSDLNEEKIKRIVIKKR